MEAYEGELDQIGRMVQAGDVVFVLGAGALVASGLPTGHELAERMAAEFGVPSGNLPDVAASVESATGRDSLLDYLRRAIEVDEAAPNPLLGLLAEQPVPDPLFLCTTYDDLLERALRAAGHDVRTVDLGDRPAEPDPQPGRGPIVVRLFGTLAARTAVVTQQDFAAWHDVGFPAAQSLAVHARVRPSNKLYIGVAGTDVPTGMVVRALRTQRRSWAVLLDPSPMAHGFWTSEDVAVIDMDAQEFAEALRQRLDEYVTTATPVGRPGTLWMTVADPEAGWASGQTVTWAVPGGAELGDRVLVWLTGGTGFAYLAELASPRRPGGEQSRGNDVAELRVLAAFEEPVSYAQLKADPVLRQWTPVKRRMQGVIRAQHESIDHDQEVLDALRRLILAGNPQLGEFPPPPRTEEELPVAELVYRLVLSRTASPELIRTFDREAFVAALAETSTDLDVGSVWDTLGRLRAGQPEAEPNPLWLAWARTIHDDRLSVLRSALRSPSEAS